MVGVPFLMPQPLATHLKTSHHSTYYFRTLSQPPVQQRPQIVQTKFLDLILSDVLNSLLTFCTAILCVQSG